jgi:hypothetical protein
MPLPPWMEETGQKKKWRVLAVLLVMALGQQ